MTARPVLLAALVAGWTLLAWGGRIGLLTGGEGWAAAVRIGGSLLIGLGVAIALAVPAWRRSARPLLYLFVAWTLVVWGRSMVVNWMGDGSLAFKLVHTVLAAGFALIAYLVWAYARSAEPTFEPGHSSASTRP